VYVRSDTAFGKTGLKWQIAGGVFCCYVCCSRDVQGKAQSRPLRWILFGIRRENCLL